MITTLRHLFVDSWAGRAAALLIFLAFISWGVGDVFSNMGSNSSNAITKVGNRTVTPDDLAQALKTRLPQVAQQMGLQDPSHLPKDARDQAARQVLQELIVENEILVAAARNGMTVPDDVVRAEIFTLPVLHNIAGQFDRTLLNRFLAHSGMTEVRFIELVRESITSRSLLQGLGQSVQVPESLTNRLMMFYTRERVFDVIHIVPSANSTIPAPTESQLQRYYANHPWEFQTPEYRHARIVLMTPDTVARSIQVPDDVLKRVYEAEERKYNLPETRTLQVLTFKDEASANKAAVSWRRGDLWSDLQKQYPTAAAVAMPDMRQSDIPSPELARAAFDSAPNTVSDPVKTATGWVVFKINAIRPPHKTPFEEAKPDLIMQVQKQEAPGVLQARQKQFQDAVAGSSTLDHIPTDLGAIPLAGTLNAEGMTREGLQAPVPGSDALRKAVFNRVFSQAQNAQPTAISGPDGSAFAVLVDDIQPGALKPLDTVRDQVVNGWRMEAMRRAANERTTSLFMAAKSSSLAKALAGQPEESILRRNITVSRIRSDQMLPEAVTRAVYMGTIGKTVMLDTPDGYWLVNVTGEKEGAPSASRQFVDQLNSQYLQSLQNDIPEALSAALERETPPAPINVRLFNQVVAATFPGTASP